MKGTPIADHDIEALIAGQVPAGREELADLAALIAGLHQPPTVPPPTPSPELAAWMQAQRPTPPIATPPLHNRRLGRRLAASIAGVGIGVQAALGATGAAAALTGAGIAGILPDAMQRPFDDVRDRLGLIVQTDSPAVPSDPEPRPGPGKGPLPVQDTSKNETTEQAPPAPSGTGRPDPAPRPERDDPADEPSPDQTNTEPGSPTRPGTAKDHEPDSSDEPAETDREEEPDADAPDDAENTADTRDGAARDADLADGEEPQGPEGGTRDDVDSDAPDAVGNNPETSKPDTSTGGGATEDVREDATESHSAEEGPHDGDGAD